MNVPIYVYLMQSLNFRFQKSLIVVQKMKVLRRNDDATGTEAGIKKNNVVLLV